MKCAFAFGDGSYITNLLKRRLVCLPEFPRSYLCSIHKSHRHFLSYFRRLSPKARVRPPSWKWVFQSIPGMYGCIMVLFKRNTHPPSAYQLLLPFSGYMALYSCSQVNMSTWQILPGLIKWVWDYKRKVSAWPEYSILVKKFHICCHFVCSFSRAIQSRLEPPNGLRFALYKSFSVIAHLCDSTSVSKNFPACQLKTCVNCEKSSFIRPCFSFDF